MLHTVKNLSPIKNTRWGLPHYTTSGDFEIPLVKHSLLKSMLVMFSISLRFATFPLSFFYLAVLSGSVCYSLHKSGRLFCLCLAFQMNSATGPHVIFVKLDEV